MHLSNKTNIRHKKINEGNELLIPADKSRNVYISCRRMSTTNM